MVGGGDFDDLLCIVSNNIANEFERNEIENTIDNYEVNKRYLIKLKQPQNPDFQTDYFYLIQITNIKEEQNIICFSYVSKNIEINNINMVINIVRSEEYETYFRDNNIEFSMSRLPGLRGLCIPIENIETVYSEEPPGPPVLK